MLTVLSPLPLNASCSIVVRLVGRVTAFRFSQYQNAEFAMVFTPCGMANDSALPAWASNVSPSFVYTVPPSALKYGFSSGISILSSDVHCMKLPGSMYFRFFPADMRFMLRHAVNTAGFMAVTDSGMSISSSDLQKQYLQPIITQYFIDNKSEIWLLFLIAHSKR